MSNTTVIGGEGLGCDVVAVGGGTMVIRSLVLAHNGATVASMATSFSPTLQVGDPAPDFSVTATDGSTVALSDFAGRPVVLYFYPKDNTPGCNLEACGFRDAYPGFSERGVAVLGVSVDPVTSHRKFAEKFQLPFRLLADVDKFLVQAYGVWGEKSFLGRTYMGTHRATFLIGSDGRIRQIWAQVTPKTHAQEILAFIDREKR